MTFRVFVVFFGLLVAPLLRASYAPHAGECEVGTWEAIWHDAARNRDIPVKIYYPTGPHAPQVSPVIVFSHGLGGSREAYSYLGEAWAAHGYISVHPQHHGSDADILTASKRPLKIAAALKHAAADPANLVNRPQDISFVIDRLTALAGDPAFPLHGRLDLKHLAVAGHSFGAYTVMAVVGQAVGPAANPRYFGPDPRVVAAIAMSSQPAAVDNLAHAYDKITVPIFHLTGTHDESLGGHGASADDGGMGHTSAAGRRVAYDHTTHAPAYLLIFQGGDHMVFSGREPGAEAGGESRLRKLIGSSTNANLTPANRDAMHRLVVDGSLAFWEATLRGNAEARAWLEQGGFAREVGALGTFEEKNLAPK
jgi:dienelactone hydrolase